MGMDVLQIAIELDHSRSNLGLQAHPREWSRLLALLLGMHCGDVLASPVRECWVAWGTPDALLLVCFFLASWATFVDQADRDRLHRHEEVLRLFL
jgi:hypothetical protein